MIARALRVKTWVTTALLLAGVAVWIASSDRGFADDFLTAGLLLLMVTPVSRLIAAIHEEIRAREWTFAALGVAMLLLLVGSFVVSTR